jgi:hypothetical protein
LDRVFGLRRDEVTGGCRKLHNKVLIFFAKYNLNDQVKEDEMSKACSTNGRDDKCV